MHAHLDRRDLLRITAAGATAWAMGGATFASEAEPRPMETVRVGLVGIGNRGTWLLKILLGLEGVQIKAVCDIVEDRVAKGQDMVTAAGQAKPAGYSQGETDFKRLCETEDLDLVVNAVRPWKWHAPICVAAMTAGKHTATEVPAAETVEEGWQLGDTAEKTGRHCVILENCCYFRNVMLVHHMLRKGLFGELRHCEAGYQHYYQKVGSGAPRSADPLVQTGNSYPTHAIGPVAQWMDINRGNRFDYLVSMSADGTRGNPGADNNTSLIRTVNGQTITLYYDTKLPRPYDLIYACRAPRASTRHAGPDLFRGPQPQERDVGADDEYYKQYEHPLWKSWGQKALSQAVTAARTGCAVPPDPGVANRRGPGHRRLRRRGVELHHRAEREVVANEAAPWTSPTSSRAAGNDPAHRILGA
jgi:hypothetical protein